MQTRTERDGLFNKILNKLPIELHIPGYRFCGPGTKLKERLSKGQKGINLLDEGCKEHDIAYSLFKDLPRRHQADLKLIEKASERIHSPDSKLNEKLSAWLINKIMKTKVKLGLGHKNMKSQKKKNTVKKLKPKKQSRKGRIIQTPKIGGMLPLIFAGLSALGALAGGSAAIAKAVTDERNNRKQLEENIRHNKALEIIKETKRKKKNSK